MNVTHGIIGVVAVLLLSAACFGILMGWVIGWMWIGDKLNSNWIPAVGIMSPAVIALLTAVFIMSARQ